MLRGRMTRGWRSGESVNRKYLWFSAVWLTLIASAAGQQVAPSPTTQRPLLDKYCVTCHSDKLKTGGLSLQSADLAKVPENAEIWEKVIRKVRVQAMPPQGMPRPDKATMNAFAT